MNILESILNVQNGGAMRHIGSQVGLNDEQTTTALRALVPALAAGLQRNAAASGGLESLAAALARGGHSRYVDDPATLSDPAATADGNGILGHVFGSKEVSREVAAQAAARTGIGADVLKRMLPLAATVVMGTLARQSAGRGAQPSAPGHAGGGILSMLSAALDQNRDGSLVDEVTRLLGRTLGG